MNCYIPDKHESIEWRALRSSLAGDLINFYIKNLHIDEALRSIKKVISIDLGEAAIHFEYDVPAAQLLLIYCGLCSAGTDMARISINGIVPMVDNIPYIEKMARRCGKVLLTGFFEPRTLCVADLSELVVVTKYLLFKGYDNLGLATRMIGNGNVFDVAGAQDAFLYREFEKMQIPKDSYQYFFKERWILTENYEFE